jgi:hypothetical protein
MWTAAVAVAIAAISKARHELRSVLTLAYSLEASCHSLDMVLGMGLPKRWIT